MESIYKCLQSRHLPFEENLLIHFDSHPDMCRPEHMPACFVYDKELLLEAVNIENWILPTVYGGHINKVIWIKPYWAKQINVGRHEIEVGEWNKEIYVNSNLDYFISDGAYCSSSELKNMKKLEFDVIEFENITEEASLMEESLLQRISKNFILDIDLDFFTTKNPFNTIYTKANTYERLKEIYIIPKTYTVDNSESIIQYSNKRREHIRYLEEIFKNLEKGQSLENQLPHPSDPFILEKLTSLIHDIQRFYSKSEIDFELIHNAGCTCDYIELPHHESTKQEISEMMKKFKIFLRHLKFVPTIVTISRSSSDDYCPSNMVDFVQNAVIEVLQHVFSIKMTDEPSLIYLEEL